jgi:hypothetical protein
MTKHEPFIRLPHSVYDSPAFQALLPVDIAHLLLLLRKFNGYNNGAINLSLNEACGRCGCSKATSGRSLQRLQKANLITATIKGCATPVGKPDIPTRWNINFMETHSQPVKTKGRTNSNVIRLGAVPK